MDKEIITQHNANEDDALRAHIQNALQRLHTVIPAKVMAFNETNQTIDALPTIQRVFLNEDKSLRYEDYPLIKECPVVFIQGGSFIITTPIAAGDQCLLFFSEKCIDNWWTADSVTKSSRPFEMRSFDLSDGFALVGINNLATKISNYDKNNLVIRTKDNAKYIKCMSTGFEIQGNTKITGTLDTTDNIKSDKNVRGASLTADDGASGTIHYLAGGSGDPALTFTKGIRTA